MVTLSYGIFAFNLQKIALMQEKNVFRVRTVRVQFCQSGFDGGPREIQKEDPKSSYAFLQFRNPFLYRSILVVSRNISQCISTKVEPTFD